MAKVSKSYQELIQLINTINAINNDPDYRKNTKAIKKLESIAKKLKPIIDNYTELIENIKLDNAHTDADGCLIVDDKGSYKYSKEGQKKLNADIKNLLLQDFEFYQSTFSLEGIENFQFLEGWVEGFAEEAQVIEINGEDVF